MTEYSYSDLVKMQDQAIRRVREMQERARLTVKENPIPEFEEPPSENDVRKDEPERTEKAKKPEEKKKPPKAPSHPKGQNKLDSDMAVLLPLIMLLSQENADNMLMIALLYILA